MLFMIKTSIKFFFLNLPNLIIAILLSTLCLYLGWNEGVLYAFPHMGLGQLDFGHSFFFSVGLVTVGRRFNPIKGE